MDHLHCTTDKYQKDKHLTLEKRVIIQARLKDEWKANRIANKLRL